MSINLINYTPHSTRRGVAIWQFDTEKEQYKINDILNYVQNKNLIIMMKYIQIILKKEVNIYEYVIYAFLDNNDIESLI